MKRLFLSALMLVGLTASAQEKVRVHIGNESFITLMDYISFDVDETERVVSVSELLDMEKKAKDLIKIQLMSSQYGDLSVSGFDRFGGDATINIIPYNGCLLELFEVNGVNFTDSVVDGKYIIKNVTSHQNVNADFIENKLTLSKKEISISNGDYFDLTTNRKGVVWTSSNTDVATVDANGRVTAVSVGTTTITATINELTATCNCNVFPPLISSIGNVNGVVPGGVVKEYIYYDAVPTGELSSDPLRDIDGSESSTYYLPEYNYTMSKINIESGSFLAKGIVKTVMHSNCEGMYWTEDFSAFYCQEERVPTFDNVYVCPTTDKVANPWDNQFFIQVSEDGWGVGSTHKVSYFFATKNAVPFTTEAQDGSDSTYYKSIGVQCHVNVREYKHWNGAGYGQCIVDGKWHKIDVDYYVDADVDGMKTFAFNLNDPAPANIFFFTEISVE